MNSKVDISKTEEMVIKSIVWFFAIIGSLCFISLGNSLAISNLALCFFGGLIAIIASALVWKYRKQLVALYHYL